MVEGQTATDRLDTFSSAEGNASVLVCSNCLASVVEETMCCRPRETDLANSMKREDFV